MLTSLVLIVHIIVCIALILIILLQSGKGADIGAVFGGGSSQTLFGSTGATPFLSKVTIGAAVIFMCTSIVLTFWGRGGGASIERSLMTDQTGTQAPVETGVPVPPGQAPGAGSGEEKKEGAPGAAVPAPESSAPSSAAEGKAAPSSAQPAPAAPPAAQQPAPAEGGAKPAEAK
ncbi:MAG: preprotein translocase subunit SecG [Desulfomonile tiedjei]|nr:preprotein translocase subunit SecG [Desulfomonile tiedjei]